MSQYLPREGFRWLSSQDEIDRLNIMNVADDNDEGYVLEVDLNPGGILPYSSRSEVYKFVAWGSREDRLGRSNLDLPIYISMVSAQLPSNKTKSRPLTVVHSHVSSACFFISCLLRCVHLGADMFIHRL